MYKVSLIVPIYGVERYIRQFAESALGQTYPDMQFVFVNDGTKDRSMEILQELIEEKFSGLKSRIVIVNKENGGLPSARKAGLDMAEGEYILFADSDDWLDVDAVAKVMAKAEETDADIVYFDLIKEYGGGKVSYKRERVYTAETKEDFIINIFNYKSHGYTVTKCFRKNLYTDNPIVFPKHGMHEDIYLMSQIIFYAKSLAHLPEGLYHYRKDNPDAMCAQERRRRHRDSDVNLMDLYVNYRENLKGSPIEKVAGGIIMRAGWHSILHGFGFFEEYPYLADDICSARLSLRYRVPLPMQLIVKVYSFFRKICRR
jgi:glycosyltransferase involved in cell wall biosynthesis